MSAILGLLGCYFLLGWLGARIHLILWHREFGDYDGAIGLAAFFTVVGPVGFLSAVAVWLSGFSWPHVRAARFWGLS